MTILTTKDTAILAVVLLFFLLTLVIYSPLTKIDVLGDSSKCIWLQGVSNNQFTSYPVIWKCCSLEHQDKGILANNTPPTNVCVVCHKDSPTTTTQYCDKPYREQTAAPPPPSLEPQQPPPSPPPPPPSNALPQSTSQQQSTTTCPDGSTPDANGNCPNTSIQQQAPQGGPETSNNNNPQGEHHHKGNNNLLGGESTTKKSKNDNGNSQSVP
jgi:hypothetical protein